MHGHRSCRMGLAVLLISLLSHSSSALSININTTPSIITPTTKGLGTNLLDGDWEGAKAALRNPECCVVSVPGISDHLRVLQEHFADGGPADIDLRARVRVQSSAAEDCISIRNLVVPMAEGNGAISDDSESAPIGDNSESAPIDDACTAALCELARGVASLADGPLEGVCEDVFIRIVCASDYKAIDPMYHTDKAPLRGYVTLRGVGTEYMTRSCSPIEYAMLRGLGEGVPEKCVVQAEELEFIVMKGDHYAFEDYQMTSGAFLMNKLWKRANACVHRSPPATTTGGRRRVIVSLDLADGDDDREWYQVNSKREWRSGMTQRKSRLVA